MPGCAPSSSASRKTFASPGPTAVTMPSDRPNFICRGAGWRPDDQPADELLGLVGRFDAGEDLPLHVAAEAERELEQLLRLRHFFGRDHAGDAQIDLGEVVDRDQVGQQRLGCSAASESSAGDCWASQLDSLAPGSRTPGLLGLLSSIMASTSFRSTRFIMWLNLATGVPTSGCCDCVPARDRLVEQLAGLLGQPRQHRRQVDDDLPEQIEADRADVLQLGCAARLLGRAPTASSRRRTDSPGRPAP